VRVYETAIRVAASISRTFSADTLKAAKSLRDLAKDTKKLEAAQKSAAAYKKLDDELKRSKTRYDQAAAALRRLKEAEEAAGGATKESTQWIKAGEKAVASAAREMDRATKAAKNHGKALHALGIDTRNLEREQARLASAGRFAAARRRIFGDPKEKDEVPLMERAGAQAKSLARDVAILGAGALTAGAGLAHLTLKSLEVADEIGDTAANIGIGTTALQQLRFAAVDAGGKSEDLDKSLKKMLVTVGKFKSAKGGGKGSGSALPGLELIGGIDKDSSTAGEQDPFKRIGLSAKQLSQLKPEQQMLKIADGMKKLKTQADRAAVGTAIFGKSVPLALFEDGAEGIEKMMKAADRFGGVLSEDVLKAADEADRAMRNAKGAFAGVSVTLGAQLLPVATKVFTRFSEWVAKNKDRIKEWGETAAKWIEHTALPAIVKFSEGAVDLAKKGAALVDRLGGMKNVLIGIAAVRLAPLALTIAQIGANAVKAAASLLQMAAANRAVNASGGGGPGAVGGGKLGKLGAIGLAAGGVGAAYAAISGTADEIYGDRDGFSSFADDFSHATKGFNAISRGNRGSAAMEDQNRRNVALARMRQRGAGGLWSSLGVNPAGNVQINVGDVHIGADASREQVVAGAEQVKQSIIKAHDRKRAQFSEAE
jgi:hypothetical protein